MLIALARCAIYLFILCRSSKILIKIEENMLSVSSLLSLISHSLLIDDIFLDDAEKADKQKAQIAKQRDLLYWNKANDQRLLNWS